jgi:hypothetical protein
VGTSSRATTSVPSLKIEIPANSHVTGQLKTEGDGQQQMLAQTMTAKRVMLAVGGGALVLALGIAGTMPSPAFEVG